MNVEELTGFGESLAPDVALDLCNYVRVVPRNVFERLAPVPPPTGVIAIAKRPSVSVFDLVNSAAPAPVVLLENPRNLLNIGAAIRVSAAAGAAGVLTTGVQDPWNPAALIAGTGLQYAVPVARTATIPICNRSLIIVDQSGESLQNDLIPTHSILAFGSERKGLSKELTASADRCVSIPMSPGVSSLNLATAVAVALYAWKFGQLTP